MKEKEALDLWSRYEYCAAEAKKDLVQTLWDIEEQEGFSEDEFDANLHSALLIHLKETRNRYRECHRLELQYMRLLRTF